MIERLAGRMPVLGVCLGHQVIVEIYGGEVEPRRAADARQDRHGHARRHAAATTASPSPFEAGRYHSLAALEPLPDVLVVTAATADGEVMGVRHRDARPCTACSSTPSRC